MAEVVAGNRGGLLLRQRHEVAVRTDEVSGFKPVIEWFEFFQPSLQDGICNPRGCTEVPAYFQASLRDEGEISAVN